MQKSVDDKSLVVTSHIGSRVPAKDTELSGIVQGNFCDLEPHNQQGKSNPAVPDGLALSSPNIDIRQVGSGSSNVTAWVMEIGRKSIRFQKPVSIHDNGCLSALLSGDKRRDTQPLSKGEICIKRN